MTQLASEKYWAMGPTKAVRAMATPAAHAHVASTSRLQQVLDLVRGKLLRGGPTALAADAQEVQKAIGKRCCARAHRAYGFVHTRHPHLTATPVWLRLRPLSIRVA